MSVYREFKKLCKRLLQQLIAHVAIPHLYKALKSAAHTWGYHYIIYKMNHTNLRFLFHSINTVKHDA